MRPETVVAVNRFGLGARPGELNRADISPRTWLKDQLQGPAQTPALIRDLRRTPEILSDVQDARMRRREARQAAAGNPDDAPVRAGGQKSVGATARQYYLEQVAARYRNAAKTDYPFHERLVHFWSNHFAVSADRQPLSALSGAFENEAIRPNVTGRFLDLLLAVEQHPAMLLYLNNERSVGPNSTLAKRARRRDRDLGLNENLAREILELHTLGVDGGYSQADVTSLARIITGWSIGGGRRRAFGAGAPGTFQFHDSIHEPGAHSVLGIRYSESGLQQGQSALRDLAQHPSTARHLATKLARHFVADVPPPDLVEQLAHVYEESDGDLAALYIALIDANHAWTTTTAKYKSPSDFVVSAFRAFDYEPDNARSIVSALDLMGQTPYRPGSPAGWPDTSEEWGGADALYKRIEWADRAAHLVGPRVNPAALAERTIGPGLSASTRDAISGAESVVQGTTLFLASPDFQRR